MSERQSQLDRIENRIENIEHVLVGNGEPESGHVHRIAMLEANDRRRSRIEITVLALVATLVVTSIYSLITGKMEARGVHIEVDRPAIHEYHPGTKGD